MNLTYDLVLKKPAIKFIKSQDKNTQLRILQALEGLKKIPPHGDVKKIKGSHQETFRLRIGTFRALFSIDHTRKQIVVEMIGNRGDIY